MNLTKDNWTSNDIPEFQDYLEKFQNVSKREWSQNLLQTKLPVLCMKIVDMKDMNI